MKYEILCKSKVFFRELQTYRKEDINTLLLICRQLCWIMSTTCQ